MARLGEEAAPRDRQTPPLPKWVGKEASSRSGHSSSWLQKLRDCVGHRYHWAWRPVEGLAMERRGFGGSGPRSKGGSGKNTRINWSATRLGPSRYLHPPH